VDILIQLLINGILLGGAYAGLSVGLTLIFGVVRIVNFAHGEFLMIGMYATYLLVTQAGLNVYQSMLPVALLLFALGFGMQKLILQPIMNADPHMQIFATVGVSFTLMNVALLVFGANVVSTPNAVNAEPWSLAGFSILPGQVATLCVSLLGALALRIFLHRTFMGRALLAISQNRNAAALMGINIRFAYALAFGLGAACVGLVSATLTTQYPVFPTVGSYFVLVCFVVVVLGGLGSIAGSIAGAMIIGIVDSLAGFYVSTGLKEVVYFAIFILILAIRPAGLFGKDKGV